MVTLHYGSGRDRDCCEAKAMFKANQDLVRSTEYGNDIPQCQDQVHNPAVAEER